MIGLLFESYAFIGLVTATFTMVQFAFLENGSNFFAKNDLTEFYDQSKLGFENLRRDPDYNRYVTYVGMVLGASLVGLFWITIPFNLYKKHMKN